MHSNINLFLILALSILPISGNALVLTDFLDKKGPFHSNTTAASYAISELDVRTNNMNAEDLLYVQTLRTTNDFMEGESEDKLQIGQTTLEFYDETRYRPVVTEVWYPTSDSLKATDEYFSPFLRSHTVRNGTLPNMQHPLIMISHGNGGNRFSLEWLAQSLVEKGYVVAAVDHWGNTLDNKIPSEFVKPWERPLDISIAIDRLLEDTEFKEIIDPGKIGALGFSYGGYTVIALAGAVLDYSELLKYYQSPQGKADLSEINEFPGEQDALLALMEDESFIRSTQHIPPLKDSRIKAIFAISPGTAQGFVSTDQFEDVQDPVFIVGCEADLVTPVERYARHYHKMIPESEYFEFPGEVGHYVMLAVATDEVKKEAPVPFVDHPSVDRQQVHQRVKELSAGFFGSNL